MRAEFYAENGIFRLIDKDTAALVPAFSRMPDSTAVRLFRFHLIQQRNPERRSDLHGCSRIAREDREEKHVSFDKNEKNRKENRKPLEKSEYCQQKGWFSFGYNDDVVPPTTAWATYNTVTGPKEISPYQATWHFWFQEQWDEWENWLLSALRVSE